jgi:hypothetical protein
MNAAIDANVTNSQLKGVLKGIVDRTSGDVVQVHHELAKWFDSSMDRVSGVYKRKTQLWSFLIALAAAAVLNVNSVEVGKALWKQPMLAKTIAPRADQTPAQVLDALDKLPLPVGWTKVKWASLTPGMWSDLFLGWLITAFATLFGAPFWFDALQQIVRLKGTGPSPANKISGNAAAG